MNGEIRFSPNLSSNVSFVYDLQKKSLSYTHPSFRSLFNVSENAEPQEFLSFLTENDREQLKSILQQLLDGSFFGAREFYVQLPQKKAWILINPVLLNSSEGKFVLGSVCEITDDVEHSLTLQKFANKKNAILNTLSHDLRGPLSIARTLSKALGDQTPDSYTFKSAENISKILEQALNLVNDLLQREFFETMEVELVMKSMDIVEKTREYIEEFKKSEDLSHRKFSFSSTSDHIFIDIDEAKFMQIYNNLVSNALKFTRPGGRISVSIKEEDKSVIILFSDDGVGIPEKFHPILFDKFTEARRQGLNGELTIGLGLSIVKTIVKWHNGTIHFESEEGKGTTFIIEIPKVNTRKRGI